MDWKAVEFTGSDSAARVQVLQALCGPPPKSVDALLLIGGIDSFHSTLSQAAIKFLFLGSSGQELLGEQVISQEHERLEDVVLLLTSHSATIFYSSESDAAIKILPMIARWRHVQEVTIHDAMDVDDQEARKIQAFRSMVTGVDRIGIPYGFDPRDPLRELQDPMIPEKWPLIQSYGLESHDSDASDPKGFFTMNHRVVNVSKALRGVLAQLDAFSAKRIALEVAPLLTHHYNQFLLKLDHAESPESRNAKTEAETGEDLLSFYEFGTMQFAARGLTVHATRGSRVLYGQRTSDLALKPSSNVRLIDAGVSNAAPATHMLVQVDDPFSGVRFVRTYFFATGKVCRRVVDDDALVQSLPTQEIDSKHDADTRSSSGAADTQRLTELYVLLLRGFQRAMETLVKQLPMHDSDLERSSDAARAAAAQVMTRENARVLDATELPVRFVDDNLAMHAECLDARGLVTELRPNSVNLVYVSLTLMNIPSCNAPTERLGSLAVGDSLLLHVPGASAATDSNANSLCVTQTFPYFRSWLQSGNEADAARALVATLRSDFMLQSPAIQLGHAVATMDAAADADAGPLESTNSDALSTAQVELSKASLLIDCDALSSLHGTMRLFTGGFVFLSPHVNPLVVSFAKHVLSFQIVATKFDELVLLRIDLKPNAKSAATQVRRCDYASAYLQLFESMPFTIATRELYIPLLTGSRFQEEILHVLAVWKRTAESLEIPFYRPLDLELAIDGDSPRDSNAEGPTSELPTVVYRECADLVARRRATASSIAISDAIAAFFPSWFIPKDSNAVTTLGKPDVRKLCVPVTAMIGIPGSDVVRIAQSVCDISSDANDWVCVVIDARHAPLPIATKSARTSQATSDAQYVADEIERELTASLERICANVNPRIHPRLMLVVVAYVDAVTVAAAIARVAQRSAPHPTLKLSLLAAVVRATNVFVPDVLASQSPLPALFDQLAAGFATHIVVTHSADVSSSHLGRLRFRIDHTNPFADVHVLSHDVFEGPITPLLAIDRFESVYYARYRNAHYPEWPSANASDESTIMPERLRFAIAPGMERARFLHLVGATLTPLASGTNALDANATGLRVAQALASDKVRASRSRISECGTCWSVEARVVFASERNCVYHYVSTGTSAHLQIDASSPPQAQAQALEVLLTGLALNAPAVLELLRSCYAHDERSVAPLRTKASVTLDEKRAIQQAHALDPLPDDVMFDGSTYVDFYGGRYEFHPRIDEFIDAFVADVNATTARVNAKAEASRDAQQTFVQQIGIPSTI